VAIPTASAAGTFCCAMAKPHIEVSMIARPVVMVHRRRIVISPE
jgi:hypothetical protein